MPATTNVEHGQPGWLSQAPSGDLSLDDIFASLDAPDPSASATQNPDPNAPSGSAPVTPAPEQLFLDAGQTKYKTSEEAAKGVRQKDEIIKKLREDAITRTGIDPLTGKQVAQAQSTPTTQPNPVSFLEDDDAFFKELGAANAAGDSKRYKAATVRLFQEMMAPYAPVIADVTRQGAEQAVTQKFSDFGVFKGTEAFQETLDRFPTLKNAIEQAEHNPALRGQLGEFYEMLYLAAQGTKLPEAMKTAPNVVPVPQVATTLQPVTPTPSGTYATVGQDLTTSEGRKQIIQNFEARGLQNQRF